jgi:hypothetical protein
MYSLRAVPQNKVPARRLKWQPMPEEEWVIRYVAVASFQILYNFSALLEKMLSTETHKRQYAKCTKQVHGDVAKLEMTNEEVRT